MRPTVPLSLSTRKAASPTSQFALCRFHESATYRIRTCPRLIQATLCPYRCRALASQKPYIPAKGTPEGDYFRTHIRNYYACITGVDENIGRIIRTLKECGVFDNTLIIFSSDHGICMGGHGIEGKNVSTKNPCESR